MDLNEHILIYNKDLERVSVLQLAHTSDLSFLLHIQINASNHP